MCHDSKPNYFTTVTIYSADMSDSEENKLLILIYMELFAKVICNIRNRIGLSMNIVLPSCMVFWSDPLKCSTNAHLRAADTLGTQKPSHHSPTISGPHL